MLGFESLFRCQKKKDTIRCPFFFSFGIGIEDSHHSSRSEWGSHTPTEDRRARSSGAGRGYLRSGEYPEDHLWVFFLSFGYRIGSQTTLPQGFCFIFAKRTLHRYLHFLGVIWRNVYMRTRKICMRTSISIDKTMQLCYNSTRKDNAIKVR